MLRCGCDKNKSRDKLSVVSLSAGPYEFFCKPHGSYFQLGEEQQRVRNLLPVVRYSLKLVQADGSVWIQCGDKVQVFEPGKAARLIDLGGRVVDWTSDSKGRTWFISGCKLKVFKDSRITCLLSLDQNCDGVEYLHDGLALFEYGHPEGSLVSFVPHSTGLRSNPVTLPSSNCVATLPRQGLVMRGQDGFFLLDPRTGGTLQLYSGREWRCSLCFDYPKPSSTDTERRQKLVKL